MNNFMTLFEMFAGSDFFLSLVEILVPFVVIYAVMGLVGGIIHGKYV